jgi:hypothetical protein
MATLLPRKADQGPLTRDDQHYEALAADPQIKEFPQGSTYDSFAAQRPIQGGYNNMPQQPPPPPPPSVETTMVNTNEDFINKKWRPMMGWMYMTVCIFDFVIFPIFWAIVQFWETEAANDAFRQWNPLTLQGAGLFHMAMGAVIGVTAWGRTKEKLDSKQ